ncbi:uncharacterized protein LOC118603973 isoform X4 [Rousettus aegyptiacus]|uniref:uncharacterized protein LOC118603973 isoform X4 n=1 Tax=Rousettus aegyptiacus TaxID=9407 RepID=UPI00168D096E|nr:uncharacterized protein LOC118603973 isoform X4 [Rousettus aegyptiacus]
MPPPSTILTPLKSPSASSRRPAREWRACPCGSLKQKLLPDSLWEKPAHPSTYTDMSEVGSLGPASEINAKIKRVKALAPCLVMNVGALPSSLPSNSALDMGISRCLPDCESAPYSWDPGTCRGTSSHVIPVNTVPEPGVEVREVTEGNGDTWVLEAKP